MRESRTSGSVGRAPGNRCLYPELFSHKLPFLFILVDNKTAKRANKSIILLFK